MGGRQTLADGQTCVKDGNMAFLHRPVVAQVFNYFRLVRRKPTEHLLGVCHNLFSASVSPALIHILFVLIHQLF